MAGDRPEFKPGVPLRPPRVDVDVPVRYRVAGEQRWRDGRCGNVSRTGALIHVETLLPTEEKVEIMMTLPAGIIPDVDGAVVCTGVVTRIIPATISGGALGIAFETIRAAEEAKG